MADEVAGAESSANMTALDVALSYLELGYRPIPIKPGTKEARVKWDRYKTEAPTRAEICAWWTRCPDDGVAIVTGEYAGFIVIDEDGAEGRAAIEAAFGPMPRTTTSITGGGGRHYLFRASAGHARNYVALLPSVDVRATGGYIVVAPTLHASGASYKWDDANGCGISAPLAPLPEGFATLLGDMATSSKRPPFPDAIPQGTRNNTLTARAGALFKRGWSSAGVRLDLLALNATRCQPPLDRGEVETIVTSIANREAGKQATVATSGTARNRPRFHNLATVEPESVSWLWHGYIALGKLTLIQGDPGLGKSTLAVDLAARVSAGLAMPDGTSGVRGGVIILSGEDSDGDTIRPRVDAAGGDASRIRTADCTVGEDGHAHPTLVLPDDIDVLRTEIRSVGARLVIIDPLVAYFASGINSWRDQDVRRALSPLGALATETGVAVVLIAHLNKREGQSVMYRGGGSIGIVAATRAAFVVAADPKDEASRVLAPVKFNIARFPTARTFRLVTAANGVGCLEWTGTSNIRADQLISTPKVSKLDGAVEFLRDDLADGPALTTDVNRRAADAMISEKTLERARSKAKVKTKRNGFRGPVLMYLEDDESKTEMTDNDVFTPPCSPGTEQVERPRLEAPYSATRTDSAQNADSVDRPEPESAA